MQSVIKTDQQRDIKEEIMMMNDLKKEEIRKEIESFRMPLYSEIPNVGLYLEQVSKYITDCFSPLSDAVFTGSMISNYVKKKLIVNPVKKQYGREQIAYLIFIAVAKSALSIEEIRYLIELKKKTYDTETAYSYFCTEFERTLKNIFGNEGCDDTGSAEEPETHKETETEMHGDPEDEMHGNPEAETEKKIMRSILIIYCRKVYLSKMIGIYREDDDK